MKTKLLPVFGIAVALVSVLFLVISCAPPPAANGQYFGNLTAQTLTASDLTLSGKLVQSTSSITLTAGQLITPTKSTYLLSSTGAVSMTLAPCSADTVSFVALYGDDNNTITVNDTNIYTTDGNAVTLGQYDVTGWVCAGTKWSLAWKSANQ